VATSNQIPGNIVGINSATINTSDMNIVSGQGAVYGYSGQPAAGNLYLAISASGGTDQYGNTISTGLTALSGSVQGFSLVGSTLDATSTLNGTQVQQAQILAPGISGGTAVSMTSTMTNTGGQILGYTSGSSAPTYSTAGTYSWTCPTGITAIQVQCWGGGAGGGGGNETSGGESGGGGEYAAEPSFAVTPGNVYTIVVGGGGSGGATGVPGTNGGTSSFSNINGSGQGVVANGGVAGLYGTAGVGGSGSSNTIHFDGGNGVAVTGNEGGCGGGGSASAAGEGNAGSGSTGTSGASGGSALAGGGAGGAGGNTSSNGVSGGAPGGGGGGAGNDGTETFMNIYQCTHGGTYSYYGSNANGNTPNGLANHDGLMYQGQPGNNSAQGYQYSVFTLNYQQIQSDLSGKVVSSVALGVRVLHGYYSTLTVQVSYTSQGSFSNSLSYPPPGFTAVTTFNANSIPNTYITNMGLDGGIGVALQNGNCKSIVFGDGAVNPWQDYYGYLDSGANGGYTPQIEVYFSDGGVANAGNGGAGKVVLTYNAGSTPVYTLSVSAAANTDSYGNPYNPGVTSPQVTVPGSQNASTTPAAVSNTLSTSVAVASNNAGTLIATNAQGFTGHIPLTLTDATTNAVTGTAAAGLSAAYTIPANDPQLSTAYRLTAWGDFHSATATLGQVRWQVNVGATSVASITVSALGQTPNTFYEWYATSVVQWNTVGSGGNVVCGLEVNASVFNASLSQTNTLSTYGFAGGSSLNAVSTAVANTYQLLAGWSNTTTGQTVRCFGSMIERIGP
jgi:hypothetical protein